MSENIEIKYNLKYTNRYGKENEPVVKVMVYDFTEVENEHHFIDASKNEWSVIDNTIVIFDNAVRFNAIAYRRTKRIA